MNALLDLREKLAARAAADMPETVPEAHDSAPETPETAPAPIPAESAPVAPTAHVEAETDAAVDMLARALAASARDAAALKAAAAQNLAGDVYGPKLAAYLGRLADPVKRDYAVLVAAAMHAGSPVPPFRGDWTRNAAESPADVAGKVRKHYLAGLS